MPDDASPDEILRLIERHRVTVGFGNPDLLDALARSELWPQADLSSVRFVLTGGAPVPERLIRAYLDRGVTLLQGYGLSEAAPLALLLDPERRSSRIGSAGQAAPAGRRPDRGRGRRRGEAGRTGELLVRGPNVMAGYWNRPEATEVLSTDGWLRTGDAARSDDEGYVWIVDRVADRFLSVAARLPGRRRTGPAPPSVDRGRGRRGSPASRRGGRRASSCLAPGAARRRRRSSRSPPSSSPPTRCPPSSGSWSACRGTRSGSWSGRTCALS